MADDAESSSDESLDLTNQDFDALRALYSRKTIIPVPGAPTYDNLTKWESIFKGITAKKNAKKDDEEGRKFLPHQGLIQGQRRGKPIECYKNILGKMQNTFGPLRVLYNCMQTKTKVKVYTRGARGIRGHVEAYIAAFDKHWNLALEDCLEVWTRKVKRKAPALGLPQQSVTIDEDMPKVIVKESNGKTETLERHVPQMLLRGEQVAVVVKIQ
ncbi:U7 snRNA-associated Sm-like protein LSm11 [Fopius arisanus]|uniref:U7 snRNA-associated Sm-like protein LSm11 n=2 Tax=Fopius arisanus TaxID=64838 RepID=A0A9R1U941_9HYME|nr:PREDICTED: U7 snRNA-associated Sm-like protein LSm11 [Fopius arisanus]